MSDSNQSFSSHAMMVPGYHYIGTALLLIPTIYFGYAAATSFSVANLMIALFAVGVNIIGLYARLFPLGVQDRVIRLEERMRMERLFTDDLKRRINDVSTDHLIGLRFASDEELADLTRRVLDGELADRKSVKQAIKTWRADYQRI